MIPVWFWFASPQMDVLENVADLRTTPLDVGRPSFGNHPIPVLDSRPLSGHRIERRPALCGDERGLQGIGKTCFFFGSKEPRD